MGASKLNKNVKLVRLQVQQDRPCGECNACCTTIEVRELDKPAWTRCMHVKASPEGSCGIWGAPKHPAECRAWYCLWRKGFGGPEDRPDKLGVVLQVTGRKIPGTGGTVEGTEFAISAHEVEEGLLDFEELRERVLKIVEGRVVIGLRPANEGTGYFVLCEDEKTARRVRLELGLHSL